MFGTIDYFMTYSIRAIMHMNFNFSRKLFYKSNVIVMLLKTLFVSIFQTIFMAYEIYISKVREPSLILHTLKVMPGKIEMLVLIKIFLIFYFLMLLIYSVCFMIAATEILPILMFIITSAVVPTMTFFMIKLNSYIFIIGTAGIGALIFYTLAWMIIKNKKQIGVSWFYKLTSVFEE